MIFDIIVPVRALSLNQAYPTNKYGRRYLSDRAKEFKDIISRSVPRGKYTNGSFCLDLTFSFVDYWTKDKRVNKRRPDTSNCIKLIEDSVFEAMRLDDSQTTKVTALTIPRNTQHNFIRIKLSHYFDLDTDLH